MGKRIPTESRVCSECHATFETNWPRLVCGPCRIAIWEKRYPNRRAEQNAAYRAKTAARRAEYSKKRYESRRDEFCAANKAYRTRHRDRFLRNRGVERDRRRHRLFGTAPEVVLAMMDWQGGKCKICGRQFGAGVLQDVIDHDHSTGLIRGLLCHNCNLGLGSFSDDPARLASAIEYLELNRPRN